MHKQYVPLKRVGVRGFTIVELLIVVVVIAILATVTVVAYSGMQDRAYVAKASSAVDSWAKLLELYKVDHGSYPSTGPMGASVCLGEKRDYLAQGRYEEGECSVFFVNATDRIGIGVSSDFNNLFRQSASSLPGSSLPNVTEIDGGSQYVTIIHRGIIYTNSPTSGVQVSYYIKGSGACPRGEKTGFQVISFDAGGGEMVSMLSPSSPGGPVDSYLCRIILSPPA